MRVNWSAEICNTAWLSRTVTPELTLQADEIIRWLSVPSWPATLIISLAPTSEAMLWYVEHVAMTKPTTEKPGSVTTSMRRAEEMKARSEKQVSVSPSKRRVKKKKSSTTAVGDGTGTVKTGTEKKKRRRKHLSSSAELRTGSQSQQLKGIEELSQQGSLQEPQHNKKSRRGPEHNNLWSIKVNAHPLV